MIAQPGDEERDLKIDVASTSRGSATAPGATRSRASGIWLTLAALSLVLLVGGAYLLKFAGPISGVPKTAKERASPAETGVSQTRKALTHEQLERMVTLALGQTQTEPTNASAWVMLAHSYEMLGKFSESAKAYTTLAQLLPKDAQVLADYADVLAVINGRSFKGEPNALLKRALSIDPKNAKALLLAGSARFEEQDYAQSISLLERARAALTDPALQQEIDLSIVQAKAAAGAASAASAPSALAAQAKTSSNTVGAGASAQVSGRVVLADALRAKAPAQATLFLYARPVDGSRMPVALLRKKISDLPLNFTLDDSMGMVPNVSLSKLSQVVVVARISARGDITPAPGDLEGVSAPVSVGAKNLKLEIAEVLK